MTMKRVRQFTRGAADQIPVGAPPPTDELQHVARSDVAKRRFGVAVACGVVAVVGVATLGQQLGDHNTAISDAGASSGPLTQSEYSLAVKEAQSEINEQNAKVSTANGLIMNEAVDGNLGRCPTPSLRVQLIGTFPNINLGGPGGDGPPTALYVTMDPQSGAVCQVGVGTGVPKVYPDVANLLPDLSSGS